MTSLAGVPLFAELEGRRRVLLAGCGGGFDVYCALPLFVALRARGVEAFLGSLTFADVHAPGSEAITPVLTRIDHAIATTAGYFPEHHLASWLAENGHPSDVYCFDRTGVTKLRAAYELLVERLAIDAIVVVDGGTDSLMRGDEAGLGTPHEDVLTLVSLDRARVPAYLACLGFGVDAFHGVCHAHFLENVAALSEDGAFLGTFSLLPQQPEARAYLDAVAHATRRQPDHPSIVNTSIAAAVAGRYGDHHSTERTRGSTLWINPLMAIYWSFALQPVVDRILYKETLRHTESFGELVRFVEGARKTHEGKRPRTAIPV